MEKIKKVMIYYNEKFPLGYTTAKTQEEAIAVCMYLVENTEKAWSFTGGDKHWKTGKPAYYTIFAENS